MQRSSTRWSISLSRDAGGSCLWRTLPAQFPHGPTGIPDFRHVTDLVAFEFHHVNVICVGTLAGWWTGTTLTTMRPGKHSEGTDTLPVVVGGKRFHDIPSIRYKCK